ncbi:MAG TPA: PAS domain S-box protein [Mucilaginibacter sp.]|nr:PAS domain S-box protein [Mucilaginibacter sp.]
MEKTVRLPLFQPPQSVTAREARFSALIAVTADILYRMNPDWTTMQELDGRGSVLDTDTPILNWLQVYIPDHERKRVGAAIRKAIKYKSIFELEHQVNSANGGLAWVASRAAPVLDDDGKIVEWIGIANDITARKCAEKASQEAIERLEELRRLYETITSNTPDLIYVFDLQYRFTYVNEALLTMWGKTWDTAVGKGLRENGYEEWHAQMHEREIDQIRLTKQPIRGEVSFPHATLGRRIYDYIFTPVLDAAGEVIAIAGTTRDITDIRNAETAITESEARFRTMAEGTDVMIGVNDENGTAVYFNEAWTRAAGRTMADLLENGWIDLMHADDRERVTALWSEAVRKKTPFQWEFRMPDRQGGYRWLLARGTPRFRTDGAFAGYISATVDITEMKENDQRKNDFISMVSHELKTPLTSLNGYVQVLRNKAAKNDDPFMASALDNALKQVRKMTAMINGFLNLSRLETGKMPMDRQDFDLGQLVREAAEEAKSIDTGHRIIVDADRDARVNADREKIGQVIYNLLNNAAKYSAPGTTIRVSCTTAGGKTTVSVTDQGIGVSADDLPRLFERFYRVKTTETRHIAGFGIGLYLAMEIVKGNDGEIHAESTPGQGSRFYFSLPLSQ